jgi:nucleoside-diphosphate-sugar epimerase
LISRSSVEDLQPISKPKLNQDSLKEVIVFGASGTVGDGILKALLMDKNVQKIQVITRRLTPRIEEGVEMGKVVVTKHMDYLDYAPIKDKLLNVKAVYWALGTSARNVSDEKYTEIHVDFPVAFVNFWLSMNKAKKKSFHLITGAGTGADSWFHWAREKAKAENQLSTLAKGSGLRFIAYRPSFVMPSTERVTFFKSLLYAPLDFTNLAVKSTHIGQCMMEATMRENEIGNGSILNHSSIHSFAEEYRERYGIPD